MKMIKYAFFILFISWIILCFAGCFQKEENQKMSELEKKLSKDIHIEERTNEYLHEQTIAVSSNNKYRCIDSDVYFNVKENQYTITFKFGIPIDEEINNE